MFYEIYRHEHEGEAPRASCHVYCIKHEDFSCYMYRLLLMREGCAYDRLIAAMVTMTN